MRWPVYLLLIELIDKEKSEIHTFTDDTPCMAPTRRIVATVMVLERATWTIKEPALFRVFRSECVPLCQAFAKEYEITHPCRELREQISTLHEDREVYDDPEFERYVIETGYSSPQALILMCQEDPHDDCLLQFATDVHNGVDPIVYMTKTYWPRP